MEVANALLQMLHSAGEIFKIAGSYSVDGGDRGLAFELESMIVMRNYV